MEHGGRQCEKARRERPDLDQAVLGDLRALVEKVDGVADLVVLVAICAADEVLRLRRQLDEVARLPRNIAIHKDEPVGPALNEVTHALVTRVRDERVAGGERDLKVYARSHGDRLLVPEASRRLDTDLAIIGRDGDEDLHASGAGR